MDLKSGVYWQPVNMSCPGTIEIGQVIHLLVCWCCFNMAWVKQLLPSLKPNCAEKKHILCMLQMYIYNNGIRGVERKGICRNGRGGGGEIREEISAIKASFF